MAFTHSFLDFEPIDSQEIDGKRFYTTPGGVFPSVTTVIGAYKGDEYLAKWRKDVGEREANKIVGQARVRGTAVHKICENYVLNKNDWAEDVMPMNLDSFLHIRDALDRNVGTVYGVEVPLWSSRLRTAGRTDLFADWQGTPAVIDFKTSRKIKSEEHVWGYFIQKTCYGDMIGDRLGIEVPLIVTVMMVDHEKPQIWVKERAEFIPAMTKVFVDAPRPTSLEPETLKPSEVGNETHDKGWEPCN